MRRRSALALLLQTCVSLASRLTAVTDPSVLTDDQPHWCTNQGVPHMPTPECSTRAVGRMGLSGNIHVDDRPTDEAIAEQQRMTEAYYADPDV